MLSAHRYVAYTSDIGESFRPIAHPYMIKTAYGISWAYLIGDVGHEGYKAYLRNQRTIHPGMPGIISTRSTDAREALTATDEKPTLGHVPLVEDYRTVMLQRAVFQGLASMGLPAFTIHSIVRYSGRALKNAKNPTIRTWGPIGVSQAYCKSYETVVDIYPSLDWQLCRLYLSCLISLSKKQPSGSFTRLSKPSQAQML